MCVLYGGVVCMHVLCVYVKNGMHHSSSRRKQVFHSTVLMIYTHTRSDPFSTNLASQLVHKASEMTRALRQINAILRENTTILKSIKRQPYTVFIKFVWIQ